MSKTPAVFTRRTVLEDLPPMYLDEVSKLDLSDLGGKLDIENPIGTSLLKRLSTAMTIGGRLLISERGSFCVLTTPGGGAFMVPNTTYKFKIANEETNPKYCLTQVDSPDGKRRIGEIFGEHPAHTIDERMSHDFFDPEEVKGIKNHIEEKFEQNQ